jgi:predicted acylesterase/phospholipase RssA
MSSDKQVDQQTVQLTYDEHIEAETRRAAQRRAAGLVAPRPPGHENVQWAMALSGGGVRSATFSLGVLQALAESESPRHRDTPDGAEASVLGQIDYLSTVSGGGYIGTFFNSLFIAGRARLDPESSSKKAACKEEQLAAAAQAYGTLRTPAKRLHTTNIDPEAKGANAMGWLRENGRYLAPSSAGDLLYGLTIMIRAWFAMHYAIGTILLLAMCAVGLAKIGILVQMAKWNLAAFAPHLSNGVWWSAFLLVPTAVFAILAVPCGVAYWNTYPPEGKTLKDRPGQTPMFWLAYAAVFLCFLALAIGYPDRFAGRVSVWAAAVLLLSALLYVISCRFSKSISQQRVLLTRALTVLLKLIGVLALIGLVDTLAQTLYLNAQWIVGQVFSVGALVWIVHRAAPIVMRNADLKKSVRIPLEAVMLVLSIVLGVALLTAWDLLVLCVQWNDVQIDKGGPQQVVQGQAALIMQLLLIGTALAIQAGRYPGFLNLSSLLNLYSARLTRAYQGASNYKRFHDAGDPAMKLKSMSSSEAWKGDHVEYADYHANPFGPMHIINVCMNQNVDPAQQLIQRDRQGRPLAVLPAMLAPATTVDQDCQVKVDGFRFAIDGCFYLASLKQDPLTIGEWIGVSGAAISTGSGRMTSPTLSLLLGLSNVRIGRWWESGIRDRETDRLPEDGWRALLPQLYLLDEIRGKFYGLRKPRHHLSDGGHFENTGIYELLRAPRNVRLVIACDCGADPDYRLADLANLIRMARIDFDIDIEVDQSICQDSQLGAIFATPGELGARPASADRKCAMLLNVYRNRDLNKEERPDMRIVLIKPRMVACAAIDVQEYHANNPTFPQQTTGDQFFDEAQWESYRKLGEEIGKLIFSERQPHHAALWSRLLAATK